MNDAVKVLECGSWWDIYVAKRYCGRVEQDLGQHYWFAYDRQGLRVGSKFSDKEAAIAAITGKCENTTLPLIYNKANHYIYDAAGSPVCAMTYHTTVKSMDKWGARIVAAVNVHDKLLAIAKSIKSNTARYIGQGQQQCVFCGSYAHRREDIQHNKDCPIVLANAILNDISQG